jgi:glycosyltransferase involved in cell wall biosynthesis
MPAAEPIRVLYVHHFAQIGGGETALLDVFRFLDRRRVQPVLLAPPGSFMEAAGGLGVECIEYRPREFQLVSKGPFISRAARRALSLAGQMVSAWPENARQIGVAARIRSADVVHCFTHYDAQAAALAASGSRLPLVITCHSHNASRLEHRAAYRFAREVWVPSQWVKDEIAGSHFPPGRLRVVSVGVDTEKFSPSVDGSAFRQSFGLSSGEKVVGLAARLLRLKRHDVLIKAAGIVAKRFQDVRYCIVGGGADYWEGQKNGNYQAELDYLAGELKIKDKIIFTGERKDIPQALAAMDVVVNLSANETFGRSVAEAMASARPVICADSGAVPELVAQGKTGILIPYDDPQALADSICGLIEDPPKAQTIGRQAREFILRNHSMQQVIEEYLSFYETTAGAQRR